MPEELIEEKLSKIKKKEEESRAKLLAEKLDLPYLNLLVTPLDPEDLLLIPLKQAQTSKTLAIKRNGKILNLAVCDPGFSETAKLIAELQNREFEVHLFIISASGLRYGLKRYQSIMSGRANQGTSIRGVFVISEQDLSSFQDKIKTIQDLQKAVANLSPNELLTIICAGAIGMKASDIHLEPEKEIVKIRYRLDGLLQHVASFPIKDYRFLLSRIKTLADLILNVSDKSQDGRFTVRISSLKQPKDIDIRVSTLPSNYGESTVMRLLGSSEIALNLKDLGIRPELLEKIQNQISRPNGIILATGPTGSGKTTTLYACLNFVNKPGIKIITVEDPIEYQLNGITQTPIKPKQGQTFATSLKSIVRQDPDVLMVGEIRDNESAQIALQFALTGHLVFSTLHTNDAAGAVPRLLEMQTDAAALSGALNLVIAQRLLRKLCPQCKKAYAPSVTESKQLKTILAGITDQTGLKVADLGPLFQPQGCPSCHGLGYRGRVGIFELFINNEKINELISQKANSRQLFTQAKSEGMLTLAEDAALRVSESITSIEEMERIIGPLELIANCPQ